jgi:cytidylate kinase
MTVIALTQEMGSLAKEVAEKVASDLGLAVMRHEVVDHVASRMHVPTSLIKRLREGKAGAIERMRTDRASVAVYTTEEVLEVAARGNVVLRGWGATCLLRPVRHVVCVRVTRPFEQRVAWLMDQLATEDVGFAEDEIRRSDRAHAARMEAQFGVTWGAPLLYDLVLNTDRVSVESCAAQIAALARRPEFAETEDSRAKLHDMALAARVRAALRADEATANVDVTIASTKGHVVLQGIVLEAAELPAAERVARSAPGVTGVDNQLRVMARSRLFPGGS